MGRKAATAMASIKGAGIITVVDVGLAVAVSAANVVGFVAALGLALLVESASLMLIGGAMSFSGQPGVRKLTSLLTKTNIRVTSADLVQLDAYAAAFALVGVFLFVESLALAAFTM